MYQAVLRTLHEVFEGDYVGAVQTVVINALTTAVDPATGRDEERYIATCRASRGDFDAIDLSRVAPRDCFRSLHGLTSRRPASLRAIQPLRRPSAKDEEPLGIDVSPGSTEDLLVMDPFAFEQLVGALFRRLYDDPRVTVEVTQASRDGGIDVLVIDPDTVKGGTTVIQVKRYGGVVGIGHVRELYGTMMNVRAARGLLVATGHFGPDARVFAEDKPIALIDGDELLRMLSKHGWVYRLGDFAPSSPK